MKEKFEFAFFVVVSFITKSNFVIFLCIVLKISMITIFKKTALRCQ